MTLKKCQLARETLSVERCSKFSGRRKLTENGEVTAGFSVDPASRLRPAALGTMEEGQFRAVGESRFALFWAHRIGRAK
jgi:hypothetical protein